MKIANIIYENKLVNHTEVEYINYYNESIEYDKVDKTLPTLYVGWHFMKKCNPNNNIIKNADILKKKIITNELYWEYSFDENKSSHVKGIENFIDIVPQFYFFPKYTYINLDPIFFQIKDINDLMDIIPKKINALYNYKNEIIYILCDNKITGLDLKIFDFFQFNIQDIITQLTQNTETCYTDFNGDIYVSQYKIFPNFTYLKRYLIVMLSK